MGSRNVVKTNIRYYSEFYATYLKEGPGVASQWVDENPEPPPGKLRTHAKKAKEILSEGRKKNGA
jgi:hypothetical protein